MNLDWGTGFGSALSMCRIASTVNSGVYQKMCFEIWIMTTSKERSLNPAETWQKEKTYNEKYRKKRAFFWCMIFRKGGRRWIYLMKVTQLQEIRECRSSSLVERLGGLFGSLGSFSFRFSLKISRRDFLKHPSFKSQHHQSTSQHHLTSVLICYINCCFVISIFQPWAVHVRLEALWKIHRFL